VDQLGKKELLSFYNRHLIDFGDSPQAVRWTPEGQRRRYETLFRVAGDFSGKKSLILDAGRETFMNSLKRRVSL
jgi:hypothetical protein